MTSLSDFFATMAAFLDGTISASECEARLGPSASGTDRLALYPHLVRRQAQGALDTLFAAARVAGLTWDADRYLALQASFLAEHPASVWSPAAASLPFADYLAAHGAPLDIIELADYARICHRVLTAPTTDGVDGLAVVHYTHAVRDFALAVKAGTITTGRPAPQPSTWLLGRHRDTHRLVALSPSLPALVALQVLDQGGWSPELPAVDRTAVAAEAELLVSHGLLSGRGQTQLTQLIAPPAARAGLASLALVVASVVLAACSAEASSVAIPDDMHVIEASADPRAWLESGYQQLTPPIRPPTNTEETAHIVVYLYLPDGTQIVDGLMPDGARAARVEYAGPAQAPDAAVAADWRVLDVRAFEWHAGRKECSVLRPGARGDLVGLAWPCSAQGDERAGAVLAELARSGRWSARGGAARERMAHHVVQINGCTQCHTPARAEDRHPGVLVQRGTDAAGLFTVRSVFRDEDAAERYRPVDSNRTDPYIDAVCPESRLAADGERCSDGQWARRRFDLITALAHGDPHARDVCATRRALGARILPLPADLTTALAPCTL